jgi:hypothetical protein
MAPRPLHPAPQAALDACAGSLQQLRCSGNSVSSAVADRVIRDLQALKVGG